MKDHKSTMLQATKEAEKCEEITSKEIKKKKNTRENVKGK